MTKTIFVQIAAYRDRELPRTIHSCLTNAALPQRLRFGICMQYGPETASDLAQYENDERFRIHKVDYTQSGGCCWARNRTNRLYEDEDYTLQIDAHMRFAPRWDEELVGMIEAIEDDKPLLTTYPPAYVVRDGKTILSGEGDIQRLKLKKIGLDLTTRLEGETVPAPARPGRSRFIAAGYFFTLGRFCREVEYDPDIYFSGEEITLAARAYTHGYNFYYPNKNLVWHLYHHDNPLHWADNPDQTTQKQQTANHRIDTLLIGDHTRLGKYGLGGDRTLEQYEKFAGIDFSQIAERRELGEELVPFRRVIRLNTGAIEKRDDYAFWVFCLLTDDDIELYRYDIYDTDVLRGETATIFVDEQLRGVPTRYLLWPKHRDWGPRLVYPLPDAAPGPATEKQAPDDAVIGPHPTIFVALAAYREPELVLTIEDCLARAQHPQRLRFGICLQYDDEGPDEIRADCLGIFESDPRFRIVKYPYQASRGGCWARNIVQSLYRDEVYTLQVDGHTRFLQGWDDALVDMLRNLPSPKPLITGFPPLYHRIDGRDRLTDLDDLTRVPTTLVKSWNEAGWIHHPTELIAANTSFPRRTRVVSGAFVFTLGKWNHEVNQDPEHLYTGEEFALTLRSYTWGYDLFNPSHIVVWHRNHPQPNPKYITDFDTDVVRKRHDTAMQRLNRLLSGDTGDELGPFGLGRVRTLEQYRVFSGLDCRSRTIHPDAQHGVPPDPVTLHAEREAAAGDTGALDVTIFLAGAPPIQMCCDAGNPVLDDLHSAMEQNAVREPGSADRLMYLNFDAGHEIYFLQSRLLYFQTRPAAWSGHSPERRP